LARPERLVEVPEPEPFVIFLEKGRRKNALSRRKATLTVFDQRGLTVADEVGGAFRESAVQIAADRFSAAIQRPAASPAAEVPPPVDLTQLAVAQTNAKMTAAAGAALGQATGELTGVLVNISV
jgi:hypothetical protein